MSDNDPLATTLQALINEEQRRTADARDRLGTFGPLVQEALALFNTCVKTIDRDQSVAAATMLPLQKSAALAFLSYVRGHIAHAEFNMRQAIEFTALTAYMLAHPQADFLKRSGERAVQFEAPQTASRKAYRRLNNQHGHVSALLTEMKQQINDTTAHAGVYLTHLTFDWDSGAHDSDVFRG